jgi:hypothetical protein
MIQLTPKNKIWRILPLTVFGTWFTYKLYKSAFIDFFFDGIIFLFIGVIGLSIFIWTIRKDLQEYKLSKTLTSYLPTMTGLTFILTILALHLYQDNKINSPTLIRAFYDGGYNGFSIDLKENGDYIMANGSGLGQSYFYGTYTIQDSIVTLDKSNIDNVITTNKLVIRPITNIFQQDTIEGEDTIYTDWIFQIDKNGKELNNDLHLRVTDDNRLKNK